MDKLYLGVGREIITPEIGCQLYGYNPNIRSTCVNDDLTATAFYFKQGETEALMITTTVCLINTEYAKELGRLIAKECNIPVGKVLISATHTHSGPNTAGQVGWGDRDYTYCDNIFTPKLLAAAKKAMASPVPVKVGVASGESRVGINRRELVENNGIALGQNPWGPYNPEMTVFSFRDENETPVANLIHYGCHGTCAGVNTEITRDWSGLMTDAVENESGAITAFFNGPEGDVGPRISNGKTVGDLSYVYELGEKAAKDALKIYKKIEDFEEITLKTRSAEVKIPLAPRIPKEEAEVLYKKYEAHVVNHGAMIRSYAENVLKSYEKGEAERECVSFTQNLVALGSFVFAPTPFELFSEIGMRTDRHFNDKKVLGLSNTNGSEGYFITEDVIVRGGYEVNMFLYGHPQPYCKDADYELYKSIIKNIEQMED